MVFSRAVLRHYLQVVSRFAYASSPKPFAHIHRSHGTLFFDCEGKWSGDENREYCRKGIDYIIPVLEEKNIRATFCVVGCLIHEERGRIERIIDAGHEIASHTMTHSPVDKFSMEQMIQDIGEFRHLYEERAGRIVGFRSPMSRWNYPALQGLLNANILWNAEADINPYPYIIKRRGKKRLWRMPISTDDWGFESLNLDGHTMRQKWQMLANNAFANKHYFAIGFHPWVLAKSHNRLTAFHDFVGFFEREDVRIMPFRDVVELCEAHLSEDC